MVHDLKLLHFYEVCCSILIGADDHRWIDVDASHDGADVDVDEGREPKALGQPDMLPAFWGCHGDGRVEVN